MSKPATERLQPSGGTNRTGKRGRVDLRDDTPEIIENLVSIADEELIAFGRPSWPSAVPPGSFPAVPTRPPPHARLSD
jgi:hypothetical protein